jgi:hypothetical protein
MFNSAQGACRCKEGHISGVFRPIRIFDIVMLPPGETFDQFFFANIVLDSLENKLPEIPDHR